MNYEICKKLKDAGFPYKEWENTLCGYGENCPKYHYPTLSELIEACGDKFYGLHKLVNGEWMAFIYDIEDSTRQLETKGKTPEEAVAHLILNLSNGNIKEWMARNTGIGKEKI